MLVGQFSGSAGFLPRPLPVITTMNEAIVDEARKARVAIGVFYSQDKLNEALVLLKQSISLNGAITALGRVPIVEKMFSGDAAAERDGIATYTLNRDGLTDRGGLPVERTGSFESWIEPDSAAHLKDHINEGACVLFAFFSSAFEEAEVFRVLMKLACDKVELHDLPIETAGKD